MLKARNVVAKTGVSVLNCINFNVSYLVVFVAEVLRTKPLRDTQTDSKKATMRFGRNMEDIVVRVSSAPR
jgi:hypothetical protein